METETIEKQQKWDYNLKAGPRESRIIERKGGYGYIGGKERGSDSRGYANFYRQQLGGKHSDHDSKGNQPRVPRSYE